MVRLAIIELGGTSRASSDGRGEVQQSVASSLTLQLLIESIDRTPMQHVTFLRMRPAANLLSNTHLPVNEIAEQVGYATANSFSDTFLRLVGLRASAFLNNVTKVN